MASDHKRTLRVVIVDDEKPARELLSRLLADFDDITIVGECSDGKQAVAMLRHELPDLVFLDIQMPQLDGFEVIAHLDAKQFPLVIFVTAYDQYAVKAFEHHALDYLLKPFRRERLRDSIERARDQIVGRSKGNQFGRFRTLLEHWDGSHDSRGTASGPLEYLQRMFVRSAKSSMSLEVEHVDWIRSLDHFVELHSRGRSYLYYSSIGSLEAKLNPLQFVRIHRTTIINVAAIKDFRLEEGGVCSVALRDGSVQKVSRNRRRELQKRLAHK